MNTRTLATVYRPQDGLIALGSFVGVGVGLSLVYATTGWGIPCPFRAVTGWLCPLCGSTHMGVALLHGDLGAAWAYNPVVLVACVLLGLRGIGWIMEMAHHRRLSRVWLPAWMRRHGLVIAIVIGIVWTLARNLL